MSASSMGPFSSISMVGCVSGFSVSLSFVISNLRFKRSTSAYRSGIGAVAGCVGGLMVMVDEHCSLLLLHNLGFFVEVCV